MKTKSTSKIKKLFTNIDKIDICNLVQQDKYITYYITLFTGENAMKKFED